MDVPEGVLRCGKDCPERGTEVCHNDRCACWAAQQEKNRIKLETRIAMRKYYPKSWSERGIFK